MQQCNALQHNTLQHIATHCNLLRHLNSSTTIKQLESRHCTRIAMHVLYNTLCNTPYNTLCNKRLAQPRLEMQCMVKACASTSDCAQRSLYDASPPRHCRQPPAATLNHEAQSHEISNTFLSPFLSLSLSLSPSLSVSLRFALFSLPSVIVSLIGIHAITKQHNQVLSVTLTGKVAHFSRGVIKTELALMFEKFLYDVSLFVVECLGKWCPSPSASKQM